MIAHREVFPVRHESILLAPEHGAHVGGMVQGGVEVSVISNRCWEMHLDTVLWHQGLAPQSLIIPDGGIAS